MNLFDTYIEIRFSQQHSTKGHRREVEEDKGTVVDKGTIVMARALHSVD